MKRLNRTSAELVATPTEEILAAASVDRNETAAQTLAKKSQSVPRRLLGLGPDQRLSIISALVSEIMSNPWRGVP